MSIFPSASKGKEKSNARVEGPSFLSAQVTGILFMTISVLLFLSVISYFPEDSNFFEKFFGSERASSSTPPQQLDWSCRRHLGVFPCFG